MFVSHNYVTLEHYKLEIPTCFNPCRPVIRKCNYEIIMYKKLYDIFIAVGAWYVVHHVVEANVDRYVQNRFNICSDMEPECSRSWRHLVRMCI